MKLFAFTLLLLVLGDFAINHGNATQYTLHLFGSFWRWLSGAGSDSIFAQ